MLLESEINILYINGPYLVNFSAITKTNNNLFIYVFTEVLINMLVLTGFSNPRGADQFQIFPVDSMDLVTNG